MVIDDGSLQARMRAGERLSGEKLDAGESCPASRAIELVAHKWTIHILFALHNAGGPIRFRKATGGGRADHAKGADEASAGS